MDRFAEVFLGHQKIPMLASADLAAMTKKHIGQSWEEKDVPMKT